jgi:16S rRNA (uracil1498-N3)-methyltransferase
MALPCFYINPDLSVYGPGSMIGPDSGSGSNSLSGRDRVSAPDSKSGNGEIVLDEETSKHVVQVLRMRPGEQLQLTDGKGGLLTAIIVDDHKKKCLVRIVAAVHRPGRENKVTLAISLLKNANRLEWLLEKVTEIGVTAIIPLVCERTEKQHFRQDRMQNILVSAMLQSQQVWLPALSSLALFADVVGMGDGYTRKYIAHCLETERISLADAVGRTAAGADGKSGAADSSIILIGPEGDFSTKEIELALSNGFLPVTLGDTRLRTETAGIVAATLLCIAG